MERRGRRGAATVAFAFAMAFVLAAPALLAPPGAPTPAAGARGGSANTELAAHRTAEPSTARTSTGSSVLPGNVVTTDLLNYNGSWSGNFPSTVADLTVGAPAWLAPNGTFWWPELPTNTDGPPLPPGGPVAVYNASEARFVGVENGVLNASALVYDAANGEVFAADPLNNSVEVVSAATGQAVRPSIPVGFDPVALALDATSQKLFVANRASDNVSVVDAATGRLTVPGVTVGHEPVALAIDPLDGWVYVANANSTYLSVLSLANPATTPLNASLTTGPATDLAWSPVSDYLAAVSPSSNDLTIFNASIHVSVDAFVAVGTGTSRIVASADGRLFAVANSSGGTLRTVNATGYPFAVSASALATGADPSVLAVDPRTGSVLVWSSGARTLSSVNVTALTLTSRTVPLNATPASVAFDSGNGVLYVADPSLSAVEAIDPVTGASVSPPIALGSAPVALAVAPSLSRLFVAEVDRVVAINTATGATTSTAALAGPNGPLLFDPVSGLLWDGRSVQSEVIGLNPSTLTAAAHTPSIGTSSALPSSLTLDPSSDTVFAVNLSDQGSVRGFSGGNGAFVTPNVWCGPNVTSIVYDPTDALVYAAGDYLTAFAPTGNFPQPVWEAPLGSHDSVAGISFDTNRSIVWVHTVGSNGTGRAVAIDGSRPSLSNGSFAVVAVGLGAGGTAFLPPMGGPLGGAGATLVANADSGTISVVAAPVAIPLFAFAPASVAVNGSTQSLVTLTGGVGPTALSYAGMPTGCSGADAVVVTCSPQASGNFTVTLTATDALGQQAVAEARLTVVAALVVAATSDLPSSSEVDVGVNVTFTALASGGQSPYSYLWTFGDGTGSTGTVVRHLYAAPGVVVGSLTVTDAAGRTATASVAVVVVARPSASLAAGPGPYGTDVGLSVPFSANLSGGTGLSTATWSFDDGSPTASGLTVGHSWSRPGALNVTFRYVDRDGVVATLLVPLVVHPALAGSIAASAGSGGAVAGVPFSFSSAITGGAGPLSVSWSFGDGSSGTGASALHSYAASGNYPVTATVTDGAGAVYSTSVVVQVGPGGPGAPSWLSSGPALVLGLLLGAAGAAVALFVAERRKHRRPLRPPEPYPDPTGGPPAP